MTDETTEPLDLDAGIVQEAAQRLEAHADYLREGPDGRQPPYYFQSESYDEDIRLVLGVVRQVTRPATAWDEEALGSLLALAAQWDAQAAHNADQRGDFWKGMVVKGRECADDLRRSLAVVRERLPVKPDRERVLGAIKAWGQRPLTPEYVHEDHDESLSDAVLDLLPGRSEAEVKAEAWDEGYGTDEECGMPRTNPYRKETDRG